MENNIGILPKRKEQWSPLLDEFFEYLKGFDYKSLLA
jgi:hypothetical protein